MPLRTFAPETKSGANIFAYTGAAPGLGWAQSVEGVHSQGLDQLRGGGRIMERIYYSSNGAFMILGHDSEICSGG